MKDILTKNKEDVVKKSLVNFEDINVTYEQEDAARLTEENYDGFLYKELFIYQEKLYKVNYVAFLREFTFIQRLQAYIKLLQALMALHKEGWTHGDLHDENLMMAKDATSTPESFQFKLIDYGLMANSWFNAEAKAVAFKNDLWNLLKIF